MLQFVESSKLFDTDLIPEASAYLIEELIDGETFSVSEDAAHLSRKYNEHLEAKFPASTF